MTTNFRLTFVWSMTLKTLCVTSLHTKTNVINLYGDGLESPLRRTYHATFTKVFDYDNLTMSINIYIYLISPLRTPGSFGLVEPRWQDLSRRKLLDRKVQECIDEAKF